MFRCGILDSRRMLPVSHILLLGCLAAAWNTSGASGETERLKAVVTRWSDALETFSGSYYLSQSSFVNIDGAMHEESHTEWHIVLRQAGDNFYFSQEYINPEKEKTWHEIHSFYNDIYNTYTDQAGNRLAVIDNHEREGMPFPPGVYLTPREIFGKRPEYTLSEVLASGTTRLLQENGKRILSHSNPDLHAAVDIMLDSGSRVVQMDWVRRPFASPEEELKKIWEGDIFDLRVKKVTLELNEYKSIDGVLFPARVIKTWWRMDRAVAEDINARFDRGEITQDELTVQLYTAPVHQVNIQTFTLEDALINVPLSEGDFAIDWPDDTRVIKAKNMPEPGEVLPPPRELWQLLLMYAGIAAILLALILAGALLYRRLRH
jgi:hypothetical protein